MNRLRRHEDEAEILDTMIRTLKTARESPPGQRANTQKAINKRRPLQEMHRRKISELLTQMALLERAGVFPDGTTRKYVGKRMANRQRRA